MICLLSWLGSVSQVKYQIVTNTFWTKTLESWWRLNKVLLPRNHLKRNTLHLISGVTRSSCTCIVYYVSCINTNTNTNENTDTNTDTKKYKTNTNTNTNVQIIWKRPHCIGYPVSHVAAGHVFNQPILSVLLPSSSPSFRKHKDTYKDCVVLLSIENTQTQIQIIWKTEIQIMWKTQIQIMKKKTTLHWIIGVAAVHVFNQLFWMLYCVKYLYFCLHLYFYF